MKSSHRSQKSSTMSWHGSPQVSGAALEQSAPAASQQTSEIWLNTVVISDPQSCTGGSVGGWNWSIDPSPSRSKSLQTAHAPEGVRHHIRGQGGGGVPGGAGGSRAGGDGGPGRRGGSAGGPHRPFAQM